MIDAVCGYSRGGCGRRRPASAFSVVCLTRSRCIVLYIPHPVNRRFPAIERFATPSRGAGIPARSTSHFDQSLCDRPERRVSGEVHIWPCIDPALTDRPKE
ncbi:hypothetical protein Rhow_002654 [Rhodococcus wratislaviensis]|uniref:Uncharacterized protein n=1 Tax=Rhodococcus wratislaviensis TaxID=44752 RepID=A0A402C678_RHOWR|nr:hypothetical protein Rhow_002654 [Rhodococcus wratislaviensis]